MSTVPKSTVRKRLPMKETDLVKACLEYLAAKKIVAWRVNSGAVKGEYNGKARYVRFNGARGHSDIAGVLPNGRALFVECKVGKNDLTQQQEDFLDRVRANGALSFAVWSIDELAILIDSALHTQGDR